MNVCLDDVDVIEKELKQFYLDEIVTYIENLSERGVVCKPIFCYSSDVRYKPKRKLVDDFFRHNGNFRIPDSAFDYTKITSKRNKNGCTYSLMLKYYPSSIPMSEIKKKHFCKEYMHSILKIRKKKNDYKIKYDKTDVDRVKKYLSKLLSRLEKNSVKKVCKENLFDLCRYMFLTRYTYKVDFYGIPVKLYFLGCVIILGCILNLIINILINLLK